MTKEEIQKKIDLTPEQAELTKQFLDLVVKMKKAKILILHQQEDNFIDFINGSEIDDIGVYNDGWPSGKESIEVLTHDGYVDILEAITPHDPINDFLIDHCYYEDDELLLIKFKD